MQRLHRHQWRNVGNSPTVRQVQLSSASRLKSDTTNFISAHNNSDFFNIFVGHIFFLGRSSPCYFNKKYVQLINIFFDRPDIFRLLGLTHFKTSFIPQFFPKLFACVRRANEQRETRCAHVPCARR